MPRPETSIHLQPCCFCSFPQDGWTALMFASCSGSSDIVYILLSSGAQVDLQEEVRYGYCITKGSIDSIISFLERWQVGGDRTQRNGK